MFLHTEYVEPRTNYRIFVRFNNGVSGEVDLKDELWGEMFEPLREESVFMTAHHDPLMGTVVWQNGADLAPEFLFERLSPQTSETV